MIYRWDEVTNELVITQFYESITFGYEYTGKSIRIVQTQNVSNTFMEISTVLKKCYNCSNHWRLHD